MLVVGIPIERLRDRNPTGVSRVARAVAQSLLRFPDLKLLALERSELDRHAVLFKVSDLKDWLVANPANIWPTGANESRGVRGQAQRWLQRLGLENLIRMAAKPILRRRDACKKLMAACAEIIGLQGPKKPASQNQDNSAIGCSLLPADGEYIAMRNLDAILSFDPLDAVWHWPCELYRTRMIGLCHDLYPLRVMGGLGWNTQLFQAIGRLATRAHSICCVSESVRRDLEVMFPYAKGRTMVAYPGHDYERFSVAIPVERSWVHQRFGCRGKIVTVIGENDPRKNLAGMLHACRHLGGEAAEDRLTVVLAGRDPGFIHYKDLLKIVRMRVDVVEAGYLSDEELPRLLAASDALVQPSAWEGFGLPILEAMTVGVPVVCSDVGGLPEAGGEHAIYVDPFDPEGMSAAIRNVLSLSAEQRQTRISAARQWASQFRWERMARQIHDEIAFRQSNMRMSA